MGLLKLVARLVGALVLVAIGLGAYLYFTDYGVEAEVTARGDRCTSAAGGPLEVTAKRIPGIAHRFALDDCAVWDAVCVGYDVTYHVNTKRTIVFHEGRQIYDSADPDSTNYGALVQCTVQNRGGGLLI